MNIVDLFAGPGGWSEGLKALGLTETGIEWCEHACATARAAGHDRLQADVAALDPLDFPCDGLIASPPCQAWSMAGKGGGRRDKEIVVRCALEMAAGNDTRAEWAKECEDERSILVVEPLRWALALRPEWIALEQVPPVLELWSLFAQILGEQGYDVWAGVLEAERYGVPQTRERAILLASRVSPVSPPQPTHQRYIKGEPQRHDVTFDGEILPWISMAEALGWEDGPAPAPAPTVTSGGTAQGGVEVASRAARERVVMATNNASPRRTEQGAGNTPRALDEPAATIDTTARQAAWVPTHYDRRQGTTRQDGTRDMVRPVPVREPAPTIAADGLAKGRDVWTYERPAPTVCGDPRGLPEPKHRKGTERQWDNPTRVTIQEAAILQSFRPDYPWQGSRSKQFQQVGNAVPPLLAEAVIGALTARERVAASTAPKGPGPNTDNLNGGRS